MLFRNFNLQYRKRNLHQKLKLHLSQSETPFRSFNFISADRKHHTETYTLRPVTRNTFRKLQLYSEVFPSSFRNLHFVAPCVQRQNQLQLEVISPQLREVAETLQHETRTRATISCKRYYVHDKTHRFWPTLLVNPLRRSI